MKEGFRFAFVGRKPFYTQRIMEEYSTASSESTFR